MWLGLLDEAGHGSSLQSGTRTSEEPRGRGVRLVQLDVAAPPVARRARSRRSQEVREALHSRVVHDHAELVPYPNIELVVDTGLALVVGANNKVDVIVREGLVRPRRAANETGTDRPAFVGGARAILKVPRDAGPVNVHTEPVVDVLQMPPGRRTVLAAPADAEVRLVAVEEDEAAAGQKVALPGKRGAAGEQQRQRRQLSCNFTHFYSSISGAFDVLLALKRFPVREVAHGFLPAIEFPRPRTRSPHRLRRKP